MKYLLLCAINPNSFHPKSNKPLNNQNITIWLIPTNNNKDPHHRQSRAQPHWRDRMMANKDHTRDRKHYPHPIYISIPCKRTYSKSLQTSYSAFVTSVARAASPYAWAAARFGRLHRRFRLQVYTVSGWAGRKLVCQSVSRCFCVVVVGCWVYKDYGIVCLLNVAKQTYNHRGANVGWISFVLTATPFPPSY